MPDSAIHIHRFGLQLSVNAGTRASHRAIARRFERAIEHRLSLPLANAMMPLDKADDCVVLIKKLELNLNIDLSLDDKQITRCIAEGLKKQLVKNLSKGGGSNILVFTSETVYLKHFLLDLIEGRALQSWYYRRFSGLGALPLSAAIRTALLNDKHRGLGALRDMTDIELMKICPMMTAADAQQLLREFSALPDGPDEEAQAESRYSWIVRTFAQVKSNMPTLVAAGKVQATFYLVLRYLQHSSRSLSLSAVGDCRLCVELIHIANTYPQDSNRLFTLLQQKNIQALKKHLSAQEIADLAPIMAIDHGALKQLLNVFVDEASAKASGVAAAPYQALGFTWFGNALLLLQQFSEFPLEIPLQDWPEPEHQSRAALIRLLVISVCQGAGRAGICFRDPLVQSLCGITRDCSLPEAMAWLQQISHEQVQTVRQQWCEHTEHQSVQIFPVEKAELSIPITKNKVCICQALPKGQWLSIFADSFGDCEQTATGVDQQERDRLLRELSFLWPEPWLSQAGSKASAQMLELLVIFAQGLLKAFAYRLPGFAGSSAPYLLPNFLAMSLNLREEEDKFTAELSRVPMNVILNMAGINRGRLVLPAFSAKPIYLQDAG